MLKPVQKYIIKFRNYDVLDSKLKRRTYPDTKEVYVMDFEESEKNLTFRTWDINGLTGAEKIESFEVPVSNIKSILDLNTNMYITSSRQPA